MKFARIIAALLSAHLVCASPTEITPLPAPTTAVANQSRTALKHRKRPFLYNPIPATVPNIIALNLQLPAGVKNASVRGRNTPISPIESNVYTVEGDLWRVKMEDNDDEYHLEISARGAPRIESLSKFLRTPLIRARVGSFSQCSRETISSAQKRRRTSRIRFLFE
jgi:hypothetical protein